MFAYTIWFESSIGIFCALARCPFRDRRAQKWISRSSSSSSSSSSLSSSSPYLSSSPSSFSSLMFKKNALADLGRNQGKKMRARHFGFHHLLLTAHLLFPPLILKWKMPFAVVFTLHHEDKRWSMFLLDCAMCRRWVGVHCVALDELY